CRVRIAVGGQVILSYAFTNDHYLDLVFVPVHLGNLPIWKSLRGGHQEGSGFAVFQVAVVVVFVELECSAVHKKSNAKKSQRDSELSLPPSKVWSGGKPYNQCCQEGKREEYGLDGQDAEKLECLQSIGFKERGQNSRVRFSVDDAGWQVQKNWQRR